MKKLAALALAAIMVLAMGMTAVAAEPVNSNKGGNATVTIENSAKGETYTFYKVFDARVSDGDNAQITGYALPDGASEAWKSALVNSNVFEEINGTIVVKENATTATIQNEIESWITAEYVTETFHTDGIGGSLQVTNLPYGYYYITSGVGSMVMLNNTNPNMTIRDKNSSTPSWPTDPEGDPKGKVILVNNSEVDSTTVAIGDTVTYQIKVNTKNYEQGVDDENFKQIASYTITDTPAAGITIQSINSIVVVEGTGNDAETHTLSPYNETSNTTGYTLTNRNNQNLAGGFSVLLPWVNGSNESIYDNDAQIIITYTAVVNANATTTNENSASFTWTYVEGGQPDTPPTPDKTDVYTFSFDLVKTNAQNAVLPGAVFELYASNPDDVVEGETAPSALAFVVVDGVYRLATNGDTTTTTEITAGNVNIKGLSGTATYWLKEKTAPIGYNKLESAIEVKKAEPAAGATAEAILDTYTNNATVTNGTYTEGGIEVENLTGSLLPSTGGIGTTIFYVVGGILVIGAGILLITKKRMGKNN